MKRLLMLLALSGLAMACGDDDGGDENPKPDPDGGLDAMVPDAGKDASLDSSVSAKVTNAGAACTMDNQCTGSDPECASATLIGQAFPGGYCSASCTSSAECGSTGDCPLGDILKDIPAASIKQATGFDIPGGQCWDKCSDTDPCRTGYVCANLAALFKVNAALHPALSRTVCLPLPPAVDGGTGDGSVSMGMDASQ